MRKQVLLLTKVTSFLILLLIFSYIPAAIFNINIEGLTQNQKLIYSFGCDIAFLLIIVFAYRKTLIPNFRDFFTDFFNNFETAFKYWFIGFIIMIVSNLIIVFITGGQIADNEEAIRTLIKQAPLYMVFSIAIYAPITEELIFRKGFKDVFKSKWLFVSLSGFTFGALHVISSISAPIDLIYLIPYCSLGIAFALCYYKTDNIFSTITMHCMHNSMALILYLIAGASL